ncbi:bifunctional homocysteine S-methyltransferase/methylenetetrahydrofolate reductase [Coprococcus catus]|uniref:bifunctional homocysteine S-methyltransferase/methylenetetrahydrofolate reductase n=1 Tax=Coprococcus catus TaxID=116085 RepID=UPI001C8C465D|nr:bifunctional homocysteine S-methyltransferase/methylenetetrahydrofolate reductase [Coprococcus catus]MBX9232142.1 bifunctional homocysteine S-methyltransferase/methylenetetrahydrofolate reductase [Coprococcus catus]MCT6801065.1 bifunctional homocysteine S-methyltransferase/methylenetetrahydrofolate reductase [Coprococcus catus]
MDIREYLANNRLITDGAMGTWYDRLTGYKGNLAERANLENPQQIRDIHRAYIEAGAQLIRTNTFAVNSMFFSADQIEEVLKAAWENASQAVSVSGKDVWIAADMGTIDADETKSDGDVEQEYIQLSDYFLRLGAKVFVFETLSDFRYVKRAGSYIKAKCPDAFVVMQFSFNRNGYTRSGMSVRAILSEAASMADMDAVGFNCGVGPLHLYELLKNQSFPEGKYMTVLPNAGYPTELRGRTLYSENVPYYVEMMGRIANLGFDIIGGCCGTTPEHIRGLHHLLVNNVKPPKKLMPAVYSTDRQSGCGQEAAEEKTELIQKLERGEKIFVVELDPPFDANDTKLMDGASLLRDIGVDMITLADSPLARPRADSIASAIKMRYTRQMEAMPHISCRDKNVIAHRAQLLGMHMNGLRHALIVTGDPIARGDRESIKSVFNFNSIKLMKYVQTMNQEVFGNRPIYYGGALNHNNGSADNIAARMRLKMEAGAQWFLTQPIYGQDDIDRLRELKEKSGGRIIAGIMPLVSRKNALFIKNEMPGIHVPEHVLEQYEEGMSREAYEDVAAAISVDLMKRLEDVCDGYYMMTPFNRAALIKRIILQAKKELR